LKRQRAKFNADHPYILGSLNNLALAYQDAGRLDQALPLLQENLKQRQAMLGPDHPDTLTTMNDLASAYQDAGRLDRAVPLFRETLKRRRAKFKPGHSNILQSMNNLALAYRDIGRLDDALLLLEETLKGYRSMGGTEHPDRLVSMSNLARVYLRAGKPHQAEPLLRECLTIRTRKTPEVWRFFEAESLLGDCLVGQKKCADAEPLLLKGYEGMKAREAKMSSPNRKRVAEAGDRIVALYEAWEKPEQAGAWRRRLGEPKEDRDFPAEPFAP
jgi:tetratricopeptide (TPR) repeat protein